MRAYLVEHGVASEDIVADYGGDDTWASCVRASRVFGVDRLTVISQRYHLYRSIAACQAAGVDAVGVGDDSRPHDQRWWSYQVRELGANAKLGFDVITRRLPPLDPPTSAVQDALAVHG
jgi:vancomycin permeability regulator SanA